MIKIIFVAPYPKLEQLAKATFDEYPRAELTFETISAVGAEVVSNLTFDGDAVIARGVTASAIRKIQSQIPVIELPVTGYDVIRAVDRCKKKFNPKKVALIGSSNMIYGAQSLKEILDVEIACYLVGREDDAWQCVDQARQSGADVVIGGVMTVRIAAAQKFSVVLIESGKEAIHQALAEAVRTALIARQEREKAERVKTIMDYAHEGIIAVDKGGRVTVFNKSAQKIMNTSRERVLGRHIADILPNTGLVNVLNSGEEELGALQTIGNGVIAANRVPIKIAGDVVGAIATFQDVTKIQELEGRIRKKIHFKGLTAKYTFTDIIGDSEAIHQTIADARKFSAVDSNILIIGETGTGKELIAQSIHNASHRKAGPFVAVNCAALPPNLLESELFGYVEGAFTGAAKGGKAGLFELAHRGTIFLDEVSEISLDLQGRLLRVLQEREIMRLGDDRIIPIDVRVISATNKRLKQLAAADRFRRDLLYRLDVLNISVPPLSRRKEDILRLAQYFLEMYYQKFGKAIPAIAPEAQKLLMSYDWPGNIRELRNICERLAVLTPTSLIGGDEVRKVIEADEPESGLQATLRQPDPYGTPPRLAKMGKDDLLQLLRQTGNNKAEAARVLGISRTTLWRKLKELEIM